MIKVAIASDHAGFKLKEDLKNHFKNDYNFIDFGTNSSDSVDYPDFAHRLAKKFLKIKISWNINLWKWYWDVNGRKQI